MSPELPPRSEGLPRQVASPERLVAIARASATQRPKPAVKKLSALPMPEIAPTAFSSRYVGAEKQEIELPSTPPPTEGNGSDKGLEKTIQKIGTPTPIVGVRKPHQPVQLSSPADTEAGQTPLRLRGGQGEAKRSGLTSSVVKGEAAHGLLELMRAAAS